MGQLRSSYVYLNTVKAEQAKDFGQVFTHLKHQTTFQISLL